MYSPAHFAESRLPVLHQLVREFPLATLVRRAEGSVEADHIPMLLDATRGPFGVLRGHVARANPIWRESNEPREVLAIFQGASRYITPAWYAEKQAHGKVVPTWNYAVVHARGIIAWHQDAAWLRSLVGALTDEHESRRSDPWSVSDAPPPYIDQMLRAIVGFEIEISSLAGKWKVSQNRTSADRAGIVEGLGEEGDVEAERMARLVRDWGPGS